MRHRLAEKDKQIEALEKRTDQRINELAAQFAQLLKEQKAWLLIPEPHQIEALTKIMGSKEKALEVLVKLREIRNQGRAVDDDEQST